MQVVNFEYVRNWLKQTTERLDKWLVDHNATIDDVACILVSDDISWYWRAYMPDHARWGKIPLKRTNKHGKKLLALSLKVKVDDYGDVL